MRKRYFFVGATALAAAASVGCLHGAMSQAAKVEITTSKTAPPQVPSQNVRQVIREDGWEVPGLDGSKETTARSIFTSGGDEALQVYRTWLRPATADETRGASSPMGSRRARLFRIVADKSSPTSGVGWYSVMLPAIITDGRRDRLRPATSSRRPRAEVSARNNFAVLLPSRQGSTARRRIRRHTRTAPEA